MGMKLASRQIQTTAMNQKMIQAISILAMPTLDLQEYLYQEAEKNPALEVTQDRVEEFPAPERHPEAGGHLAPLKSSGNAEASDAFQAFLESRPALEGTIREHLLSQLSLLSLPEAEKGLCEKIIGNLDARGFHLEPPETLLDAANPKETPALLEKCLNSVRRLDPGGTACASPSESLLVQAEIRGDAPPLALFILEGHLNILEKPDPALLRKKIEILLTLEGKKDEPWAQGKMTTADITGAMEYIKTLEPFPARQFGQETSAYIFPDVYVHKIPDNETEGFHFEAEFAQNALPRITLSPAFLEPPQADATKESKRLVANLVKEAAWIIDAVEQRKKTMVSALQAILEFQIAFFERGPRFLRPLKMKDVAEKINVHEATISRIANGKYLQCDWGLFEIRYFFSTKSSQSSLVQGQPHSKESVKQELLLLLQEHEDLQKSNPSLKKLSDQELAKKLESKGIQIARRTVAKYRAEFNKVFF
jgi:RNA polymerase sigma-54 factor